MTKINEYMELLVSEMEEFRGDINRLEAINKNVKELKIGFDLVEAKSVLNEHLSEIKKQQNSQQNQYEKFERLFKKAGVYPKWAIITFVASILLSLGSILYAHHTKSKASKAEKIAYDKGIVIYENYINSFFDKNPKPKKEFEKWVNKN